MITKPTPVSGPITVRVLSQKLRPSKGWDDSAEDRANPRLAYSVNVELPFDDREDGPTVLRGTITIPTSLDENGNPYGIGFESGTEMIPVMSAYCAKCDYENGSIMIKDGVPVLARTEDPATSHWCVERMVPHKAGAALILKDLIVSPKKIMNPDSPDYGALVFTRADNVQCVSIRAQWEPTIVANAAATGASLPASCTRGARVPEWAKA